MPIPAHSSSFIVLHGYLYALELGIVERKLGSA